MSNKKEKKSLSAFSIIFLILIGLAVITQFLPKLAADITPEMIDADSSIVNGVKAAGIPTVFMATYKGFKDALDVCVFVIIIGGFLGIVARTGALDAGIAALVRKLKGRELILIPILMTLFAIGGTTYGMCEETMAFYALICGTMVAAGFDTIVGASTILLGAGIGCLGSTINPFATGVAMGAVDAAGVPVDSGKIITLGLILLVSTLIVGIWYVMRYARKIKEDKGSIFLSLQEQERMEKGFTKNDAAELEFNTKHKVTLWIFAFTFVVMILSVIPWAWKYDIHAFEGWTEFLTGLALGDWWFGELSMWFLFMGIVIAFANRLSEKDTVDSFIAGSADILSVALIIALSRGVSILMGETYLDKYILNIAISGLTGLSALIFAPASYLLYILLSFFIPSTSGLAGVSMPIMGPLAAKLGYSPEVMIMIFSAGSGIVNLVTPTAAVVMGGLAIAKVEYSTYIKWVMKLVGIIFVLNMVILTLAMMFM